LAFSMLLVFISVVIVGLLNKGKSNRFMIQLITILITFIATFFATLAITGLFFIIFPTATTDALFFFAIVALLLPGLFIKLPSQIRYTLIGTGFLLSYSTSVFSNVTVYPYILLLFLLIGLFIVQMKGIKVLLYIAVTLTLSAIFLNVTTYDGMVLWMMMIHFGYYLIQRKEIATKRAAFIIGFLYFMNSTFLHVSTALEIVSNLGFFIITTLLVLLLHRDKQR